MRKYGFYRYFFIGSLVCFIIACNEKTTSNGKHINQHQENTHETITSTESSTTQTKNLSDLNLELPYDRTIDNSLEIYKENESLKNSEYMGLAEKKLPSNFFDENEKSKEKNITLSGKPSVTFGESVEDIPEITGGEVDIKVNF